MSPGIAPGQLVALPILPGPGGSEIDLLTVANDRPVLLVLVSADDAEQRRLFAQLGALRQSAEAGGIGLITVLPDGAGSAVADGSALVAIDRRNRFAFTLGLVPALAGASCRDETVLFALDSVGCAVSVCRLTADDDGRPIAAALARLAAEPAVLRCPGSPTP